MIVGERERGILTDPPNAIHPPRYSSPPAAAFPAPWPDAAPAALPPTASLARWKTEWLRGRPRAAKVPVELGGVAVAKQLCPPGEPLPLGGRWEVTDILHILRSSVRVPKRA